MTALLLGTVGALGLLIGSFLNVVIWRVPRGESVVRPPSACPVCHQEIARRDNVPVLSWVLLRGRCRWCRTAISARYPLVESATAVLFVLVTLELGLAWELPAYLYLAAVGVALTMIDIDTHRLPNAIVLPSYPVVGALLLVASAATGDWAAGLRAVIGCAALYAFYFLAWFVYPAGMGFGDVKLAGVLGLALGWLGWAELVIGWFAAFLVAGVYALALVVVRRAGRKTGIAFGPWMLAGAAIGFAAGPAIAGWYLGAVLV